MSPDDVGGPSSGTSDPSDTTERRSEQGSPSPGPGHKVALNRTRGTLLAGDVESADGLWAKFLGLMGRPTLAAGAALWLPDSNGIHMMFMRFPIDAIFLGRPRPDGSRPVVSARPNLPAWRGLVPFVRGAHGVLELPIGAIVASGTTIGDSISLEAG